MNKILLVYKIVPKRNLKNFTH